MKQFDDAINQHYDEGEQSAELVSATYLSDKNIEQESTSKSRLESCSSGKDPKSFSDGQFVNKVCKNRMYCGFPIYRSAPPPI